MWGSNTHCLLSSVFCVSSVLSPRAPAPRECWDGQVFRLVLGEHTISSASCLVLQLRVISYNVHEGHPGHTGSCVGRVWWKSMATGLLSSPAATLGRSSHRELRFSLQQAAAQGLSSLSLYLACPFLPSGSRSSSATSCDSSQYSSEY